MSQVPEADGLDRDALASGMVEAALDAGREIWAVFQKDFEVEWKSDCSPVTVADRAAEAVILQALQRIAPGVPVVAEEEAAAGRTPEVGARFFLVDPLDGTREFVRRGSDFTVNIALIEDGAPTLGVVYAPARGGLFVGDVVKARAWTSDVDAENTGSPSPPRPLRVRTPGETLTVVASKSHDVPETEAYLKSLRSPVERVAVGSSLKFCLLALAEADLYPRPSPTSEWDTAAGHAVLAAAGGRAFAPDGSPLRYGKPRFFNPGFVASGPFDPPPIGGFMHEAAS